MRPNVTLNRHFDDVFEGYQLLCLLAEEDWGFAKLRKALLEKYGMDSEYTRNCIDLVEEITIHAKEVLKDDMPQIQRYYGLIEEQFVPAYLVLCMDFMNVGMDSQRNGMEVLSYYRNLTEQQRDAFFLNALEDDFDKDKFEQMIGCEEKGIVVSEAARIRSILAYIRNLEMKPEHRELVCDIYLNRDSYVEEMTALLDKAIAVLKTYEPRFPAIMERWAEYWGSVIDTGAFLDICDDVLGEIGQEEIQVVPCFIQGASLMITMDGGLLSFREKFPACFRMGIAMTKELLTERKVKEEYQPEEYQKILKVLGDKSKFDILLFIKDRPAYGTEIAQHFSLTTATVSHHMNQLLQLQLVQVEVREKRVYYQTKKDAVREVFEACKKMFE